MNAREDDLLQPTLAADLDVRGYGRLFRPQSLLWPAFFGGPVAAGILFGVNYARMGRRDLALRCWIGGVVLVLALATAMGWHLADAYAARAAGSGPRPDVRWMRYLVSGLSVAIAWVLARHQQPRFGAWEGAGNAPANLWIPGILACIAGAIVFGGALLGALAILGVFD